MASTCNGCDDQILYTIMTNIGDTRKDVIELSPYFSWLNPFLRFLPMWIERNRLSKPKRSLWIRIGILLTLCGIWFRFGVKALWNIQSPKIIAYKMTYILYECILTISRSISLYYFYFIFDYDMWISLSNKCAPYDGCCIPTVMYKYNCFLKICFALAVVWSSQGKYNMNRLTAPCITCICLYLIPYAFYVSIGPCSSPV
eukprot:882742_1